MCREAVSQSDLFSWLHDLYSRGELEISRRIVNKEAVYFAKEPQYALLQLSAERNRQGDIRFVLAQAPRSKLEGCRGYIYESILASTKHKWSITYGNSALLALRFPNQSIIDSTLKLIHRFEYDHGYGSTKMFYMEKENIYVAVIDKRWVETFYHISLWCLFWRAANRATTKELDEFVKQYKNAYDIIEKIYGYHYKNKAHVVSKLMLLAQETRELMEEEYHNITEGAAHNEGIGSLLYEITNASSGLTYIAIARGRVVQLLKDELHAETEENDDNNDQVRAIA